MATKDEYAAAVRAMTAGKDEPVSEEDLAALATVTAEYLDKTQRTKRTD